METMTDFCNARGIKRGRGGAETLARQAKSTIRPENRNRGLVGVATGLGNIVRER
jgi:hypothetical protein